MYRNQEELSNILITGDESLRRAVEKLDKAGRGMVVVVDQRNRLIGLLSDGDFRRSVLKGVSLDEKVVKVMQRKPITLQEKADEEELRRKFVAEQLFYYPIIDEKRVVRDVVFYMDIFDIPGGKRWIKQIDNPVVIMAGGKGTRLLPVTKVLPKALMPIGDRPIIELIMEKFAEYGISEFYITVNHKARMIKAYFYDFSSDYNIYFIQEDKELGTAGSLKFLEEKISKPMFVSNCDVLVDVDYGDLIDFHIQNNYELTLVGSMQQFIIPYGVCQIGAGGELKSIQEKPELDFIANTGVYVISPEVLEYIPRDKFFHMTDLLQQLFKERNKIGVFPVSKDSWIDVGNWDVYHKNVDNWSYCKH